MTHDVLDIAKWKSQFPLTVLRQEAREFVHARQREDPSRYPNDKAVEDHIRLMDPEGHIVSNAFHISVIEQIRDEVQNAAALGGGMPTDVFAFWPGESTKRETTKVGGLPYWPAHKSWPLSSDGEMLGFVAQFCFVDSRDVVGETPGDVLLIFGRMRNFIGAYNLDNPETFRFEWVDIGRHQLVSSVPSGSGRKLTPYRAEIHRTSD